MKYIIEIDDWYEQNMANQIAYLEKGGDVWIQSYADDASEFVPIVSADKISLRT